MTAKKRVEDGQVETNDDPFTLDMSKASGEFALDALLATFKEKSGESAQRKFSIADRITNARKNIARIQSMIGNLEIKAQTESGQVFVNLVVRPIADELRNVFPNAGVNVFGPFGLSGQATITVAKKGVAQPGKVSGTESKSVTLVPTTEGVSIRDYSETSDQYAPGSPEHLSGWNHPLVAVPAENAMEFIANWILK